MVPLHFAFRKTLLRNIPKLTSEDLDRYDNVLALRYEFIRQAQLDRLPPEDEPDNGDTGEFPVEDYRELPHSPQQQERSLTELIEAIKVTTDESNDVIRPFRARFEALHRLWMARRQLAVQEGSLLQIPTTFQGLRNLAKAVVRYQRVQVQTSAILLREAVKDVFRDKNKRNRFLVGVIVLLVVIFVLATILAPGQG